jgi:hypothetical protein
VAKYSRNIAAAMFLTGVLSLMSGCGQDKGNEPVADKSQYQAPVDSMKKTYGGGGGAAAPAPGAPPPGPAGAAPKAP